MRGHEDGGRRGGFGRETLQGSHFGEPFAKGANHAPTTHIGAERDGQAANEHHPELGAGTRRLLADRDKGKGDDAHGLLGVIGAVGKSEQAGGDGLPMTVAFLHLLLVHLSHHDRHNPHRAESGEPRNDRRDERRNEDFIEHGHEVHAFNACAHDDGAHEAAEQGVGGTRRQADEPSDEVP